MFPRKCLLFQTLTLCRKTRCSQSFQMGYGTVKSKTFQYFKPRDERVVNEIFTVIFHPNTNCYVCTTNYWGRVNLALFLNESQVTQPKRTRTLLHVHAYATSSWIYDELIKKYKTKLPNRITKMWIQYNKTLNALNGCVKIVRVSFTAA